MKKYNLFLILFLLVIATSSVVVSGKHSNDLRIHQQLDHVRDGEQPLPPPTDRSGVTFLDANMGKLDLTERNILHIDCIFFF